MRNERTWSGLNVGFAWRTSAAAPATCGADDDVPGKPTDREQPAAPPYVAVDTSLGPRMSGLIRPSIVGPRELYESTRPVCQQAAPTVMTDETVAGSTTLPLATGWSSLEAVTNR